MIEIMHSIFGQSSDVVTWSQMIARALLMGVYAVILYRLAPRRVFGRNSVIDIAFVVMIGSALSRAMTGSAPLLPTMAATATLVALIYVIAWIAPRSPRFAHLVKGSPILLFENGEVDDRVLRHNLLGRGDLEVALRSKGISNPTLVKAAYLERNGEISVIR